MSRITVRVIREQAPDGLLSALGKWRGSYTEARSIYHVMHMDAATYVGVFGDGANAAYEWFIWSNGKLTTSDRGYGSDCGALRDALIEATDHDGSRIVTVPRSKAWT